MRRITVEIDKDGKVRVLYQGFQGGACFEEAKKLYELLKRQGLDVRLEQVTPTQEYYVSATSAVREVERNGG